MGDVRSVRRVALRSEAEVGERPVIEARARIEEPARWRSGLIGSGLARGDPRPARAESVPPHQPCTGGREGWRPGSPGFGGSVVPSQERRWRDDYALTRRTTRGTAGSAAWVESLTLLERPAWAIEDGERLQWIASPAAVATDRRRALAVARR